MKKNLSVLFLIILFLGFNSCGTTNRIADNRLDWIGFYTGKVPGADSEINVGITLNRDDTYKVTYQYIDKSDDIFTYTGTFKWKNGNTVELDCKEIPPYYQVGNNTLTQLDLGGKTIVGELANKYILKKE